MPVTFPDALGDVDGLPGYQDTTGPATELVKVWRKHPTHLPDPEVSLTSAEGSGQDPVAALSVPIAVVEAARVVVLATETASRNGALRRSALVLRRLETGPDASVRLFKESVRYFMRYVHLTAALNLPLPEEAEVLRHLQIIEDVLRSRLMTFFATAEEIIDAVEDANRRQGE